MMCIHRPVFPNDFSLLWALSVNGRTSFVRSAHSPLVASRSRVMLMLYAAVFTKAVLTWLLRRRVKHPELSFQVMSMTPNYAGFTKMPLDLCCPAYFKVLGCQRLKPCITG